MRRCQYPRCLRLAESTILFTSGMSGHYCGDHDKIFHPETIEAKRELRVTSPAVKTSRRRTSVNILIKEQNIYLKSWDVHTVYPSDALPEWFQPLRPILEDDSFTEMIIKLGDATTNYYISVIAPDREPDYEALHRQTIERGETSPIMSEEPGLELP